ncbi:MAG: CvpA family protein [Woeseiaceae bacterium]
MTALDWLFIVILAISMVVGVFRGFIKEAISVGALVIAVWAAFHFAPAGESLLAEWLDSPALRVWAARIAIFALVLMLGGLIGWLISRFANQVGMSGADRLLGMLFGLVRGAIMTGLVVIIGPYLSLDKDTWWSESKLLPYATRVADSISILAPRAYDYLREEIRDTVPPPATEPADSPAALDESAPEGS